jgi:hypothetical protein
MLRVPPAAIKFSKPSNRVITALTGVRCYLRIGRQDSAFLQ